MPLLFFTINMCYHNPWTVLSLLISPKAKGHFSFKPCIFRNFPHKKRTVSCGEQLEGIKGSGKAIVKALRINSD